MILRQNHTRRDFLWAGTAAAGGLLAASGGSAQQPEAKKGDTPPTGGSPKMADEVTPNRNLMRREHGGLRRLLLVYEEVSERLGQNRPVKPELLRHASRLIRQFVEDYHEKMEEDTFSRGW